MTYHAAQPVVIWLWDELARYGPGLAALTMLAAVSGRIRHSIDGGSLGQTTPPYRLPPAAVWAIVVLPLGWWLWCLWASLAREAFFLAITSEDGWMENGQVLLLGLGSATSGLLSRSLWMRRYRGWALGYLLLALALFWTAGEEISWGQRVLRLSTPAWFESHNTQQEMNLHNLGNVDVALSDLTDHALSWTVLLISVAWLTGLHRVKRLHAPLWLPHPSLIPAFCCMVSYGEILSLSQLLHPGTQKASPGTLQLQEPREMILYFSVLAFLLIVRATLRDRPEPAPARVDGS